MGSTQHVMIFDYPSGKYVALATDIECFEVESFVTGAGHPLDLDRSLGLQPVQTESPHRLLIAPPVNKVITTTAALHIDELDASQFFLLPWLLREASCEKWVRGVVALDGPADDVLLAVWIDLRAIEPGGLLVANLEG